MSIENMSTYNFVREAYKHAFKGNSIKYGRELLLQDNSVRDEVKLIGSIRIPIRNRSLHIVGSIVFDSEGSHYDTTYDPHSKNNERTLSGVWGGKVTSKFPNWHIEPVESERGYTSSFNGRKKFDYLAFANLEDLSKKLEMSMELATSSSAHL